MPVLLAEYIWHDGYQDDKGIKFNEMHSKRV